MSARTSGQLLRVRDEDSHRVSNTELFFDLVYVFAVTQLARLFLGQLNARGGAHTLLLLVAVWWVWINAAWFTNWFDPDTTQVRLVLFGVMLGSLIMSATIPDAFGSRGLYFAGVYAVIQIGQPAFIISGLGKEPQLRRNFQRLLAWHAAGVVLWLAGGVADGTAREGLWLGAVLIDTAAPATGFYIPGLGRSHTTEWTIALSHMAERCQLFLIIALGESILATGSGFGDLQWSTARLGAFVSAFIGTVALWWIYFYRSAALGTDLIATARDPGRLGRSAFTYFHLPMVAGIIVTAVGDELAIANPGGAAGTASTAAILGGGALFLAGHALYKWALTGRVYPSRLVAILALGALTPAGIVAPRLALSAATMLILAAVASWDTWQVWDTKRREAESEAQPATAVVAVDPS